MIFDDEDRVCTDLTLGRDREPHFARFDLEWVK